ncbi:hypothetical protein DFH08DRAFT_724105, partial [Mycena albidolilacea]
EDEDEGEGDATETMARINEAVAEKLASQHTRALFHPYFHGWCIDADNILASDRYASQFSDLIRKSHETDPHVRVLVYLVMRALLSRLSGTRALNASAQLLEAINLQRLPEIDMEKPTLTEVDYLIIIHKTTSKATTNWLQVHILAYAARIPRPAGLALYWFEDESAAVRLSKGSLYVKLIRVYKLANSTSTNPLLTVRLLAEIFSYLKDDALAFLAGVWTTSHDSIPDLCVLALRHAAAFLEAHNQEADGVVLPALVICLPSADPETRTAALDCIAVQHSLAEQRFSAVYAFDAIYGESEVCIVYYLPSDSDLKYPDAVMDHREHIALEASYVKVFHVQHLGRDNGAKKKDAEYALFF